MPKSAYWQRIATGSRVNLLKTVTNLTKIMNIILKTDLRDLEGKNIIHNNAPLTIGKAIALILSTHEAGDKLRCYVLSTDFYKKDSIEINSSDLDFVKEAVNACKIYTPLVTGQLLEILSAKKEIKAK